MIYDTIVIGGGIAGLQAAIQLSRSLHKVLVIDKKSGRSTLARKYRNILGYPEGVSGMQLRTQGEIMAKRFGAAFIQDEATFCEQNQEHIFCVTTREHKEPFMAKTLLIATGITDPLPEIPGLVECLGESIYICPDCDGYEVQQKRTVVIGSGKQALQMAQELKYYTQDIMVINHSLTSLDKEDQIRANEWGNYYREGEIVSIEQQNGHLSSINLRSGEAISVERGFLAFAGAHVNSDLLQAFQIQLLPQGHIQVDPRTKETNHRNIWAAGDVNAHSQQVTISMGDGSQAAIWIHKRLLELAQE
ncbi:NAD(P)/FAD-dependent oxidoreductase [Brevibacillus laterosporus]|uniref:Thioredoxin reductase n=1 Tax=Brevibacillus laterosporus LMG 15441 TaxID=1042163 RepID=A0A075R2S8_BRELA|nr:NAD(P)/FAD-dependent oxidoreductase [Brevibacillus laterosporus]AIG26184.1 thioredoxin reductase [Brevibacillus laterosporus LMG 15441]RJL12480.1 NAD(P)/FAD-dependent oxidoreductase [Brevibacillus laterosporus]TPH07319.1 NAD(P)/FAD-dependent oxidoreductase [Brevibacillus laterosporus]